MIDRSEKIQIAARQVLERVNDFARQIGVEHDCSASQVAGEILHTVYTGRPASVRMETDGRAVPWRVRLLLFDDRDELLADTDPELEPGEAGSDVVRGLPGVASWAREIAELFHYSRGENIEWLDDAELDKKLKSLRPTLSRRGGTATWKLSYKADGTVWKAVIDVRREEEPGE